MTIEGLRSKPQRMVDRPLHYQPAPADYRSHMTRNPFPNSAANFSSATSSAPVSIAQCVNLAIRNELPTIQRLSLSTEVDLDEVPGEPTNPQSQQVIHQFLHRLIESAKPSSHLAITLINGNAQWELEVAAEFSAATGPVNKLARNCSAETAVPCEDLRQMAFECGGELEQWDCPQGGQAVVLVVAKSRRGQNGSINRRAA